MIPPQTLSLDGPDWTVYRLQPGEWEALRVWEREPPEASGREPARVPGCVPQSGADWVYQKRFAVPSELAGACFLLRFEEIAGLVQVFLNGEEVGRHRGRFVAAEWDVSPGIRPGEENRLLVVLSPDPHSEAAPVGLSDSVVLRATGPGRFRSTALYTNLSKEKTEAALSIVSELASDRALPARVLTEITLDGLPVTSVEDAVTLFPGETSLVQSCEITRLRLWWPNGHGKQPLYEARMTLVDDDEQVLDQQTFQFGVRHVERVPRDDAEGLPFGLQVNGRPVPVRGWTWLPLEPTAGLAAEERCEQLLTLAREANVNLLRVHGSGGLEKEAFYRLCDRFGIMVWQDFPLFRSVDDLPVDDAGIQRARDLAEELLTRRRSHPSLVMWCGVAQPEAPGEGPERHPALLELQAAVETEDPQRLWLPVAPAGVDGAGEERLDGVDGLLQAQRVQCEAEEDRRRSGPGTVLGCFHETVPGSRALCAVDHSGRPTPLYEAMRRAYEPFHVSASFPGFCWSGESALRAEVWLHNSGEERSLLNVVVSIRDLQGRELYQENLAGEAPENASECVDSLTWRFPAEFASPFVVFLEVIDEEGETIARNHYLHSRAAEPAFAALDPDVFGEVIRDFYAQ